jgi:DNA-binding winged helix-turn-helix (wHTH) protein/predicted ATPase/class 3 adenylate cyclase
MPSAGPCWTFGPFTLDLTNASLWRGEQAIALAPKAFDVLSYLVTHPNRLVTKDELLDAVWPETAVSEAVVRVAIGALRKVLDDTAQTPRFIATVSRRGYRFLAPVTVVDPPEPAPTGEPLWRAAPAPPPQGAVPSTPDSPAHQEGADTWRCAMCQHPLSRAARFCAACGAPVAETCPACGQVVPLPATFCPGCGHRLDSLPPAEPDQLSPASLAPALAMQTTLRDYAEEVRRTHGLAIQNRIGLNSGDVVVRTIHNDLHMDYSAVGQTTHLAARMEQLAPPGTIVLTAATLRLVEGLVRVNALELVPVKGLAEPLDVFELLGASAIHSRFQAAVARGLTRFVGREPALGVLRQALAQAGAGHGQVVAAVGEAGMGKSRLVYECIHALDTQVWLVLESAAVSYGKATPYFPVVALLKRYFHLEDGETPDTIRAKVIGQVQTLDETLQEMVPALLALLDALPDDSPFQQLDPLQRRHRILDALKRLLIRESQNQPVVLVVEDLHWIDTETQTWLDRLVDSLPAVPLLLLVNYRPEYQHGWGSKTYYTQLRFDPLSPASAAALVQDLLGEDASLESLTQLLIARTEGNPFFLEESVRTLVETQALVGTRGAYRLAQALPTIQVPTTVQAVLAARIDRLPPEEKRLLQTAAVIGMEIPLPVLHAVTALPEAVVQRSLAHLQAAEFLYEARLFPELVYTFKHALTQQVASQSLLLSARQQVHRQITHVLETRFAATAETQPERLAHHYTAAGLGAQALAYWQRAGQRAMERSAHIEAISHLTRGLEVLTTMPETPERLRHELDLQVPLGAAWAQARGWSAPEVGQVYTRAHELYQHLGEPPQLPVVLLGHFVSCLQRAEVQTARELAEHLLTLAQRQSDSVFLLSAHTTLGAALFSCGEVAAAHAHLAQGSALYVPAYHRALVARYGFDLGVAARCYAPLSLWLLGAPEQALAQVPEARTLAQELAHPFSLADALVLVTRLHQWRRDVPTTLTWTKALMALCTEHRFEQFLLHGRLLHGWTLVAQGQGDEGLGQMRQSLTAYQAMGGAIWRPYFLALLAEGYGQVGATDDGQQVLAEALAAVQQTGERVWEAELHRLKGELMLQARHQPPEPGGSLLHTAEAEACFHQALAVARRQQAKALELRAALSLARLWQQQGKRAEAHGLLAPIYGWFTEGFDTTDLLEAKALLDGIS